MKRQVLLLALFVHLLPSIAFVQTLSNAPTELLTGTTSFVEPTSISIDYQAPKLSEPIHLPSGQGLLFAWERLPTKKGTYVEYLFRLMDEDGQLIYGLETVEPELRYGNALPALQAGVYYAYSVDTRISDAQGSTLLKGNKLRFQYWPECTPPEGLTVQEAGENHLIINWSSIGAGINGIRYEIEVIEPNKNVKERILVSQGNQIKIQDLIADEDYSIHIRKLCDGEGYEHTLASNWVEISTHTSPSAPDLPNCLGGGLPMGLGCPGVSASTKLYDAHYSRYEPDGCITDAERRARQLYWNWLFTTSISKQKGESIHQGI